MWHTVIFAGNLGKDPEMRYTASGKAVTSFSVAVTVGFGDKKTTIWFRVSAWDKLAETCHTHLRKGSKVLIEGCLSPDPTTGGPKTYQTRNGGAGASYDITASMVRFLSPAEAPKEEAVSDEVPF